MFRDLNERSHDVLNDFLYSISDGECHPLHEVSSTLEMDLAKVELIKDFFITFDFIKSNDSGCIKIDDFLMELLLTPDTLVRRNDHLKKFLYKDHL
jgi:hypothetical protein